MNLHRCSNESATPQPRIFFCGVVGASAPSRSRGVFRHKVSQLHVPLVKQRLDPTLPGVRDILWIPEVVGGELRVRVPEVVSRAVFDPLREEPLRLLRPSVRQMRRASQAVTLDRERFTSWPRKQEAPTSRRPTSRCIPHTVGIHCDWASRSLHDEVD